MIIVKKSTYLFTFPRLLKVEEYDNMRLIFFKRQTFFNELKGSLVEDEHLLKKIKCI